MTTIVSPWGVRANAPDKVAQTLTAKGWTLDTDPHTEHVGDDTTSTDDSPTVDRPKRQASRQQWADYAETLGLDVTGLKRDQIIAEVKSAQD